jgi:hypothetical protein
LRKRDWDNKSKSGEKMKTSRMSVWIYNRHIGESFILLILHFIEKRTKVSLLCMIEFHDKQHWWMKIKNRSGYNLFCKTQPTRKFRY